jgi:ATP-dependent Lon protease
MILPRENAVDLDELPAETRRGLDFILVDSIEQVFDVAFNGASADGAQRSPAGERQAASGR